MQFDISDSQVSIVHNEENIQFDLSQLFRNLKKEILPSVFDEFNAWLITQPKERQKAMFNIYKEIRETIRDTPNYEYLNLRMGELVDALYQYIQFDSVKTVVMNKQLLTFPAEGFMLRHEDGDMIPEKTYIASEYLDLQIYGVCLRGILPFIHEYMAIIARSTLPIFKEHYARMAIFGSWIGDCAPLDRLRAYIDVSLEPKKEELTNVMIGLMSSDMFPEFALSRALCQRVCSVPLNTSLGGNNLVASIFRHVMNNPLNNAAIPGEAPIKGPARNIAIKKPYSEGGEEHRSNIEIERVKQNTTIGFLAGREYNWSLVAKVVHDIDPTVPNDLIKRALSKRLTYGVGTISRWHITFAQMVSADVSQVKALEILTKTSQVHAIEVARILLWHWGHKELSLLMTAEDPELILSETDTLVMAGINNGSNEADDHVIEGIHEIYKLGGVKKVRAKDNPVYQNLKELANLIPNKIWRIEPIPGEESLSCVDSTGSMRTPRNVVNLVCAMALFIAERRLTEVESRDGIINRYTKWKR